MMKKLILLFFLFAGAATNLISQGDSDALPSGPQGCSSFCLDNNGYAIFGANYDYVKNKYDGLVIVNKRKVTKTFPEPDSLGKHLSWTSRYGSVSFNFIASQTSWAGMNETGLVLYAMRLEAGSQAPTPDQRQWISALYWLQYMLDNCSTIEEVLASAAAIRIFSTGRIPHYLVSDRHGNGATIEFIAGKMVSHSGKDLPVKALANTAYDRSIAEWHRVLGSKKKGNPISTVGPSSQNRFIKAAERITAFKATDTKTAVAMAFAILKELGQQSTYWSIVFDTQSLQIHFKTIVHSEIRLIDLQKLDFSCQSPVKLLDINEKLAGDITEQLKDYSFQYHLDHALRAAKKYELKMTPEALEKYIRMVEQFPCAEKPTTTSWYWDQKPPELTPEIFGSEILTSQQHPHCSLAFSKDGKSIFWSAMRKGGRQQTIYLTEFDGKVLSMPRKANFERFASITPDGKYLFFIRSASPQFVGDKAHFYRVSAKIVGPGRLHSTIRKNNSEPEN